MGPAANALDKMLAELISPTSSAVVAPGLVPLAPPAPTLGGPVTPPSPSAKAGQLRGKQPPLRPEMRQVIRTSGSRTPRWQSLPTTANSDASGLRAIGQAAF